MHVSFHSAVPLDLKRLPLTLQVIFPLFVSMKRAPKSSYKLVLHSWFHPSLGTRIVKSFLLKTYVFVNLKLFKTKKLATPLNFGFNEVTTHTPNPKEDVTSCTLNL